VRRRQESDRITRKLRNAGRAKARHRHRAARAFRERQRRTTWIVEPRTRRCDSCPRERSRIPAVERVPPGRIRLSHRRVSSTDVEACGARKKAREIVLSRTHPGLLIRVFFRQGGAGDSTEASVSRSEGARGSREHGWPRRKVAVMVSSRGRRSGWARGGRHCQGTRRGAGRRGQERPQREDRTSVAVDESDSGRNTFCAALAPARSPRNHHGRGRSTRVGEVMSVGPTPPIKSRLEIGLKRRARKRFRSFAIRLTGWAPPTVAQRSPTPREGGAARSRRR